MAQKANPYAIRLGYNKIWNNYFFPEKNNQINWIKRDNLIRKYLKKNFSDIAKLKIEYVLNDVYIYLYMPEISLALGENHEKISDLTRDILKIIGDSNASVKVNLIEVKRPYAEAQSIANIIASQLKKRLKTRMIVKNVLTKLAAEREVKGAKIEISGRLDESDIARSRKEIWGKMPLSTLDSNIEVGTAEAVTSYGKIGVKILIYKGKIWQSKNKKKNLNYVNTQKN